MIPNTEAIVARFDDGNDLPVVAWDTEGYALIPSSRGQLFRACEGEGFVSIRPGRPSYAVLAAIPDHVPDNL